MKQFAFLIVAPLVWLLVEGGAGNDTVVSREKRQLPFWTVGRIANLACTGVTGLTGQCQTRGECTANGGQPSGSCSTLSTQAVCCVYLGTCGGSSSQNVTYFQNPGFPAPYNGGGTCSFKVVPPDNTVCQLRIDFTSFTLSQPSGDGVCNVDNMQVSGGGRTLSAMCGDNNGQHVYIAFSGTKTITVSVAMTAANSFNRVWNLQLSMVSCTSQYRAPPGCLQYFMGTTGDIYSFNYGSGANPALNTLGVTGTRQLASQNYGICVMRAAGKCTISYTLPTGDIYAFTLTGNVPAIPVAMLGTAAASISGTACTTDFLVIPNPSGFTVDRFCGAGIGTITSSTLPFIMYYITNADDSADVANRGFHLQYTQNACVISSG